MSNADQGQTPHKVSLREQIKSSLANAEQAEESSQRANILRKISCALGDRDISAQSRGEGGHCMEAEALMLLTDMVAKREAAATTYEENGDLELADHQRAEIEVIREFLPEKLEGPALELAVNEVVDDLEAHRLKDMGRCLDALKERYADRLDPSAASRAVRAVLG